MPDPEQILIDAFHIHESTGEFTLTPSSTKHLYTEEEEEDYTNCLYTFYLTISRVVSDTPACRLPEILPNFHGHTFHTIFTQ